MTDITEKIYKSKELKMEDLEKAIEYMNDKGYEVAPLEELNTVYKPDGTPYCSFNVDDKLFTIEFLEGSSYPGHSVSFDRRILGPLKKFLDSLERVGKKFENF